MSTKSAFVMVDKSQEKIVWTIGDKIKRYLKTIVIIVSLFSIIFGCKARVPQEVVKPPPIPEERKLPVDYLFMLDNSASIKGEGREFTKEAIKLFVELAETGDKVSIIAFDEEARLLGNQAINNQEDRERVKTLADEGLTFQGEYTDISSAFLYTASHQSEIFRGRGYSPVIILMTDGKLEPKSPRTTRVAYEEITQVLKNKIVGVPFYTIGLGDKEIHENFLPGVNGMKLLKEEIAKTTGGKFYHAPSVDQLINTYLSILRVTKGISETPGRYVFRIDESTERISAIVLKKTTTEEFCITGGILLQDPKRQKITYQNYQGFYQGQDTQTEIRWQNASTYYDLITVEHPFSGEWRISLREAREPKVIGILKTLINLRYDVKRSYWENEEKLITAWLYDERQDRISPGPCEMVAKIDKAETFYQTHHEIRFQRAEGGIYVATLKEKKKEEGISFSPGDYLIQIIAEEANSFLYRMSEPIPFAIKESYFTFSFPPASITKGWGWKGVPFQTALEPKAENFPPFQRNPELSLKLERIDKKGKQYPLPPFLLKEIDGEKLSYTISVTNLKSGKYAGQYALRGSLTTGENIEIFSDSFNFTLRQIWPPPPPLWFLIILGLIIGLFFWKSDRGNPRLEGILTVITPSNYKPIALRRNKQTKAMKWGRRFYLELGKGKSLLSDLKEVSIRLEVYRKNLLGKKRIKMKVLSGTARVNNQVVNISDIFHQDKITFNDGGKAFELQFNAPEIRKPKAKKK